ncbi:MAG: hypothetical protein WBW81_14895 [Methylocella sp.]
MPGIVRQEIDKNIPLQRTVPALDAGSCFGRAISRVLDPNRLTVSKALQIFHKSKDGHVPTGAANEIGDDPVNVEPARIEDAAERLQSDARVPSDPRVIAHPTSFRALGAGYAGMMPIERRQLRPALWIVANCAKSLCFGDKRKRTFDRVSNGRVELSFFQIEIFGSGETANEAAKGRSAKPRH